MANKQHKSTKKQAKVTIDAPSTVESTSTTSAPVEPAPTGDNDVYPIPSLPKPDDEPLPDITEINSRWWTIKDAQGYGSVTLTMAVVSFIATTVWFVLSIFEKIGPITIRPFDAGACSAFFVPILTTYVARKYTESKARG